MTITNTLPKLFSCISACYNDNFDFLVKIRIFFHISLQNQENLLYLCNQNQDLPATAATAASAATGEATTTMPSSMGRTMRT